MNWLKFACLSVLLLLTFGCGRLPRVDGGSENAIQGFFLLNEGDEDGHKGTLDYYDYTSGLYTRDIFSICNSTITERLGEGGNDMAIYGAKLYVVVNGSNLVEVMDVRTGWHVAQISIPNCRSIAFHDGFAYVSSYAGPVEIDPNYRKGYVAKVDTLSLQVVSTCDVGYQPEEMAIVGDNLYVANSGCYRVPDYDHTVSVVDLRTFQEVEKIDVAINLHRMEVDNYGNIWVSSRGDSFDIHPRTYLISAESNMVFEDLDLPCSDMTLCGDSLYVYGNVWNDITMTNEVNYDVVDVTAYELGSQSFITDDTDELIQSPSCIAVNPQTREILIADARDNITPGKLYCFSKEGTLKWSVNTGYNPTRIVFTNTPLLY